MQVTLSSVLLPNIQANTRTPAIGVVGAAEGWAVVDFGLVLVVAAETDAVVVADEVELIYKSETTWHRSSRS